MLGPLTCEPDARLLDGIPLSPDDNLEDENEATEDALLGERIPPKVAEAFLGGIRPWQSMTNKWTFSLV